MILVTTAGKVGSEAVLLLRQRQVPVRVLVRTPDKATALAEAGAEIAAGDLDAPASIDAAMAGITTVVLVSPGAPAQELAVIGSAARAGAGHVIKVTSNASADSPIARRRWQAEIEAGWPPPGWPPPGWLTRSCDRMPTCRMSWHWHQRSRRPAASAHQPARGGQA